MHRRPPLLSTLTVFPLLSNAFLFSFTPPTSCDPLTVIWQGGTPPFNLLVTPSLDVARNISLPSTSFSSSTNRGNYTLPQLELDPGASFLLTMSDSTGFGTGGTSALLVTGASTTGTSCSTVGPNLGFEFFLQSGGASQCKSFQISWDSNATRPVDIWGLIPLGQTFHLIGATGTSVDWTVNIATGTSFFLALADAAGNQGGTSSIQSVGSSDDSSCINANSPSSTVSSQPAQTSISGGGSSTSPSSGTSDPGSSGSSKTGTIVGAVIASILALVAVILLAIFFYTRHRKRHAAYDPDKAYKRNGGRMVDLLPANASATDLPRGTGGPYPNPAQYEPVPFLVPPLEEGSGSSQDARSLQNPFESQSQPGGPGSQRWASTAPTSTTTDATAGHAGQGGYYVANAAPSAAFAAAAGAEGTSRAAAAKRAEARASAFPSPAGRRYVLHTDAGSVLESEDPPEEEEEAVVELPPAYDLSFNSRRTTRTDVSGLPGHPVESTAGTTWTSSTGGSGTGSEDAGLARPPPVGTMRSAETLRPPLPRRGGVGEMGQ
ncbi:hypothetical protein DACRYDRAFT_116996 [Dacryopinax primogenitus]|uniref:Mid2 domain-containing protein n=1 Tax=Dacryopinax primogenitus (strain DJM 731) TaxID=1858805 RepID=M5FU57_DACPD|nr:uncharacterized protein DACRYDRAFT_116996 [Dacryopinax primogenitus]EJU01221.1 hypothetical protein DACRYDRAFT_116996 [Dacryopinax primogenitus]